MESYPRPQLIGFPLTSYPLTGGVNSRNSSKHFRASALSRQSCETKLRDLNSMAALSRSFQGHESVIIRFFAFSTIDQKIYMHICLIAVAVNLNEPSLSSSPVYNCICKLHKNAARGEADWKRNDFSCQNFPGFTKGRCRNLNCSLRIPVSWASGSCSYSIEAIHKAERVHMYVCSGCSHFLIPAWELTRCHGKDQWELDQDLQPVALWSSVASSRLLRKESLRSMSVSALTDCDKTSAGYLWGCRGEFLLAAMPSRWRAISRVPALSASAKEWNSQSCLVQKRIISASVRDEILKSLLVVLISQLFPFDQARPTHKLVIPFCPIAAECWQVQ